MKHDVRLDSPPPYDSSLSSSLVSLMAVQGQLLEVSTAVSIVSAAVVVLSTLKSSSILALFTYHPVCMSVAFLVGCPWAIRIAYTARETDGNVRGVFLSKHMVTQLGALGFALAGFTAIYVNKSIHGKDHFTSLHGKLGVITMVLALAVAVLGGLGFKRYSPLPVQMHPGMKWVHRSVGVAMWWVALIAIVVVLPHKAVVTGLVARAVQLGVVGLGVLMVMVLREKGSGGGKGVPIVDFAMVPRERSY